MAPRETESNSYVKFWSDQQRVLQYVMVFSGVVNCYVQFKFSFAEIFAVPATSLIKYPGYFSMGEPVFVETEKEIR